MDKPSDEHAPYATHGSDTFPWDWTSQPNLKQNKKTQKALHLFVIVQ